MGQDRAQQHPVLASDAPLQGLTQRRQFGPQPPARQLSHGRRVLLTRQ
jgi:hypothetical protein